MASDGGHRYIMPGNLAELYVPNALMRSASALAMAYADGKLRPLDRADLGRTLPIVRVLSKGKGSREAFAGTFGCKARVIRATKRFVEVLPIDGPMEGVPIRVALGSLRVVAEVPE